MGQEFVLWFDGKYAGTIIGNRSNIINELASKNPDVKHFTMMPSDEYNAMSDQAKNELNEELQKNPKFNPMNNAASAMIEGFLSGIFGPKSPVTDILDSVFAPLFAEIAKEIDAPLSAGDVVQIIPSKATNEKFAAMFMTVTQVTTWGAIGFFVLPDGIAPYRAKSAEMTAPIGKAVFVADF